MCCCACNLRDVVSIAICNRVVGVVAKTVYFEELVCLWTRVHALAKVHWCWLTANSWAHAHTAPMATSAPDGSTHLDPLEHWIQVG